MKPTIIEIELDNSILTSILDEISPYIPKDTTNKDLYRFISLAFNVVGGPALRADKTMLAVWELEPRFLELLPALRAGETSFRDIQNILSAKIGVRDETCNV